MTNHRLYDEAVKDMDRERRARFDNYLMGALFQACKESRFRSAIATAQHLDRAAEGLTLPSPSPGPPGRAGEGNRESVRGEEGGGMGAKRLNGDPCAKFIRLRLADGSLWVVSDTFWVQFLYGNLRNGDDYFIARNPYDNRTRLHRSAKGS